MFHLFLNLICTNVSPISKLDLPTSVLLLRLNFAVKNVSGKNTEKPCFVGCRVPNIACCQVEGQGASNY